MPSLEIYLLGDLRVLWQDKPLPPFSTHNTRSLFAYLVTHRQRAHTRARLAGLFWGDFTETRAHRNLNTTLWRLRRALPSHYLRIDAEAIAFNPDSDYWLDAAVFEERCAAPQASRAARTRALEEAVRLYRGDFLEGWYEDWALIEAERLRLLYIRALQDLIECYQASGALAQALDCARRVLEIDPLREDVHCRALELYAALGQKEAALAQFAVCRRVLAEQVGIAPAPQTVALYEQIRAGTWQAPTLAITSPATSEARAPTAPARLRTPFDDFGQVELVGREAELALVRTRLEKVCARAEREDRPPHSGGMILLHGEGGVGKTRLARETARIAAARGIATLWGACPDLQSPPPYQGVMQALRAGLPLLNKGGAVALSPIWLGELVPLLPELTQEFPELAPRLALKTAPEQGQLLEAITQFLVTVARLGPTLVVLEDLHWADPATLEALRYALPRLRALPILLIVTYRSAEVAERSELSAALGALEATGSTQRLALERLSPEQTGALARRTLGMAEDNPALDRFIYRETEGNPFFVQEVLKSLIEEGYFQLQIDGKWDTPWDQGRVDSDKIVTNLPPGIRHALQRRLALLTPPSRCVLEAAAVLGNNFDLDLLRHTCGQSEEIALEATDELLRRQLLLEENDLFAFNHDKIRQVVYKSLSHARCRALHRQAGEVLAQSAPLRVEELANHFYLAQDYARALPHCLQAGDRASALYANQSALTYYGWAIEAARHTGNLEGWRALATAYEQRGRVWEHVGNFAEALADYDSMGQAAAARNDPSGIARAVRCSGWVRGNHIGDWELGLRETRRALELARQAGDPRETTAALLNLGAFHNLRGEYAPAFETLHAALLGFAELHDERGQASALQYLATMHHFQGQFTKALAAYQQALALWQKLGERKSTAKTQANIGYLCLSEGDMPTAETSFRQAETTLREIQAPSALSWVLVGLGALQRYRGEWQACLKTLQEATVLEQGSATNSYNLALILHHQGPAHWYLGDAATAFAEMNQSLSLARASNTPTLVVGALNDLGRCLRQSGDVAQAQTLHQEALALARRIAFEAGENSAQSELGLDQVLAGQTSPGLEALKAALTQARGLTRCKRAEALLNLAEGQLSAGQTAPAAAAAQDCLALTAALGLKELEARACLIQSRALIALDRRAKAQTVARRGLACLDPTAHSPLHAYLEQTLAAASSHPGQISVRLARHDAPPGRPPRDDEYVVVVWSVDAGQSDHAILDRRGKVALRRARVLRLMREAEVQGSAPTQSDLAHALGVTVRTIRADLAALGRRGHNVQTRGQQPGRD